MSNLVEHARTELQLLGEDPVYSASLVAAVAAFASFGHSGGSSACAREQLHALLAFQPLTPLTNDPDEWCDVADHGPGTALWQNRRNPAAFSNDGGKHFWLTTDPKDDHDELPRYVAAAKKPARS
ncbi:hypothetical protein ACQPXB_36055 [Amycolatopsis sp. CA-161197]|uniref:hypothetical protein n=1 Tax=Amycolatopsis sp. CA-161197 TaxID=3239922 RepID=UPI003D90C2B7